MGTAPAFASTDEAMEMARAALGYLAAVDATQLGIATQARCLKVLEQADAIGMAARASFLAAFTAGQGYADDAAYSARAWLIHQTHVTSGAAVGHTAWAKRTRTHPRVVAALAAGKVTESIGRLICLWTDRLPEHLRDHSDELLVAAAQAGLGVEELAALAAQMYERARSELPDEDPDAAFKDRGLKLATTFGGAGVIHGDLTPECAEVVRQVLDALGAPAGKEDDRTQEERYHDALQEAMKRLVAANLLPERAGQPVKAWVHISLADLLLLDGDSALQEQWTAQVRERWAACRAFASETGSEGGAWLDGDAAEAIVCDAAMAPVVTGDVNVAALEDLVRLCVELDGRRRDGARDAAWDALEEAVIGKAVDLLSGPGGLASFLRRRQLGVRLGWPEPAPRYRVQRDHPGRDPQRGGAAGPQVPVGRRVQPARVGVRGAPHEAQEERRQDQHQGLRAPVLLPPPDRHPPLGLDPGPEPRRHHHRAGTRTRPKSCTATGPRPGRGDDPPGAVPRSASVTSVMPMSGSVALGRARMRT